jgi:zinc transport system substrate-binding protein
MKRTVAPVIIAVLILANLFTLSSCTEQSADIADIMAGTSLIANIIQDVADDKVETRTLIPPGSCPGHYDVKPSDIEALANSKALFIHNYQENFENITELIEAAENPDLIVKVIDITGNWMTPPVQAEAVDKISQALGEIDPENAAYYEGKADERAQAILDYGEDAKNTLQEAGVDGVKVICADMQAGFVGWAGFNITAIYGRPEELSPADVEQLITDAKEAAVALVIDNLQSGATATSDTMAQDIGAIQVTISNFPGGFENTETWEKTIDKNVDLLLEALNEWEEQYG